MGETTNAAEAHALRVRVWFATDRDPNMLPWSYETSCACGFGGSGWCCSRAEANMAALEALVHNCDDYR